MENSENVHFLRVDFVDGDKRQRCEGQLSGSLDAAVTSELWKCLKICHALNDLQHSTSEGRFRRLGRSVDGRVLMVAYTLRRRDDAETIRLISARRASRRERAAYFAKD